MGSGVDAGTLAVLPLFSDLPADALSAAAGVAVPFEADAGHVLVQPGMVGSGIFFIEEGSVALSVHDKEFELGAGEFFGELALLDERAVRTTRVRARTPVRGFCIDRDDFSKLLHTEPSIAVEMLKVLARRLVDLVRAP